MNVESARSLFGYNRWANRRLLEAVGQLSADEFERDLRASFGSIKGTLRHILWGERAWLLAGGIVQSEPFSDRPSGSLIDRGGVGQAGAGAGSLLPGLER